ncbi:hypothetical protein D3C81_1329020 [compost metagenome]
MPAADERVRPPTGKRRGYQTAKGVAGTPQAQYPSALLGGKEAAEVLAQPRPTGGLRQALYQHAGSENRYRCKVAHHQRRGGGNHQPAEHHHPRPEAVGQDAPGELTDGVSRQVDGVEVGHGHFVEHEGRVFANTELGDRECFAGEIERGVGEPGDREDLHAPTLDGADVLVHCGSDLRV